MTDDHDTPRSTHGLAAAAQVLKGAGAAASAAGRAFPFVHAQEKVTLRYLGTAVNQDKKIAEKFEADTGIKIQYVAVTTDDVTKRAVTAPNSFDLIDTEYFSLQARSSRPATCWASTPSASRTPTRSPRCSPRARSAARRWATRARRRRR